MHFWDYGPEFSNEENAMRAIIFGRLLAAAGILGLTTNLAEAGFHHRHLRQGGCSDTCQTASAWGNSGYGICGSGMGFAQPAYVQSACEQVVPAQTVYGPVDSYPSMAPASSGCCGGHADVIDIGPVTMYKVVLERSVIH